MDKILKGLGIFVLALAVMLYRLFICVKVWGYVLVKMFGLAPITMWQAFAISSAITAFTYVQPKEDREKESSEQFAKRALTQAVVLFVNWLICYCFFG